MSGTSYLVAIDGSEESREAAYFAWNLAKQSGVGVIAQHVVDSTGVWRFLSYDLAGFVGSGLYMDAREQMISAMYSIGEGIMLAYTSQANGVGCQLETYIDEGDPSCEIARRAVNHDLVIVGLHRRCDSFNRPRMFERLSEICSCPVLVVQRTKRPFSRMQVFVTEEIADCESVTNLYQLSAILGTTVDFYFDQTILEDHLRSITDWSQGKGVRSMEQGDFSQLTNNTADDALIVVSAAEASERRGEIRDILSKSDRRALLIWPNQETIEKTRKSLNKPALKPICDVA